ncbi:hypothetical protein [Elizabethkingia anophelis]|uniref:hypothetical protein n=1 Tax=Elizabethkingia anophelis TaxID=1117645 RepID=UPI00099AF2A6|nr:hypothetical protein [Elizabethkingia anophelis]OPC44651.1 hypothetical protein BAY05_14160 [Elizabethkingia anophelis]
MSKTHFRKVYKSDHLGVADLEDYLEEGKKLIFKLKEVKQELGIKVAGNKGNYNVAYFYENIKPLVLNVTNSSVIKSFFPTNEFPQGTPFVEDWKDILLELYVDSSVKMKGELVGGVRIAKKVPVLNTEISDKILKVSTQQELSTLFASLSKEQQSEYKKQFTERKIQLNNVKSA